VVVGWAQHSVSAGRESAVLPLDPKKAADENNWFREPELLLTHYLLAPDP
jgi:hypothetical protein